MAKKVVNNKLTHKVRELLGEPVPVELLEQIDPASLDTLTPGESLPTVLDMLAQKLIKLALDPNNKNQWAVEMVYDRIEGKAVQGAPVKTDGRELEEKLDRFTAEHLNSIGRQFASAESQEKQPVATEPEAQDIPSGPAAKLLDLPTDRARRPKNATREPAVAE